MRVLLFLLIAGCPTPKPTDDSGQTATFACGTAATCAANEVCIVDQASAVCENRTDTGTPCPEGTTASMCGGAGIACCCEPTPAPVYRCHSAGTCGATPACDCLGEVCVDPLECMATGAEGGRTFQCEEPAVP